MEKNINDAEDLEIVVEKINTDDMKKGYRVIWRLLDWNGLFTKSRPIHEFVGNESGGTENDSWTELGRLFSYPLRWSSGDKKIGLLFDGAFQSLKKFVEGRGKLLLVRRGRVLRMSLGIRRCPKPEINDINEAVDS
jgi:hypothetical protein